MPQPSSYRVRIYNQTGVEVRIKIIGFSQNAFWVEDFQINENMLIPSLYGGERAFVAWDDINQKITNLFQKDINSHMRIRFLPNGQNGHDAVASKADVQLQGGPRAT